MESVGKIDVAQCVARLAQSLPKRRFRKGTTSFNLREISPLGPPRQPKAGGSQATHYNWVRCRTDRAGPAA